MKVFLDTNVVLDMMEPRRPDAQLSATIFELARERKIELFISTQSIIDAYFIGRKMSVPKSEIDRLMNWILNHINVRSIDCFDIRQAIESSSNDVEDNAQIALAENSCCDLFITHDIGILSQAHSDLTTFLSPQQFISRLS